MIVSGRRNISKRQNVHIEHANKTQIYLSINRKLLLTINVEAIRNLLLTINVEAILTTQGKQLSVQLEAKMESVTVCFHGVTLLTNVPSELDTYMSIRNSKRSDDFIVGVAALAFCFLLDKMCYFVILNYELAALFTIFKVNCVYVVNNFFKRDINIFIEIDSVKKCKMF